MERVYEERKPKNKTKKKINESVRCWKRSVTSSDLCSSSVTNTAQKQPIITPPGHSQHPWNDHLSFYLHTPPLTPLLASCSETKDKRSFSKTKKCRSPAFPHLITDGGLISPRGCMRGGGGGGSLGLEYILSPERLSSSFIWL